MMGDGTLGGQSCIGGVSDAVGCVTDGATAGCGFGTDVRFTSVPSVLSTRPMRLLVPTLRR